MPLLSRLLILFIIPTCCFAQNLTGVWEGEYGDGTYIKMVLAGPDSVYVGYSYDKDEMGYCKANFKGTFSSDKKLLTGIAQGMIEKTLMHSQGRYKLFYSKEPDGEYLTGKALPKSAVATILSFGMSYQLRLKRTGYMVDTTGYMLLMWKGNSIMPDSTHTTTTYSDIPDLELSNTADISFDSTAETIISRPVSIHNDDSLRAIKDQRLTDTLQVYYTRADKIIISIYDNEVVDGDSITVFHNNEVLLSKQPVSSRPVKLEITINKESPRHEFVMVAENLGSIPPNTAMLVIEAGKERYRLKASADLSKNALIIFEYR